MEASRKPLSYIDHFADAVAQKMNPLVCAIARIDAADEEMEVLLQLECGAVMRRS
jgi:hypothetical protein